MSLRTSTFGAARGGMLGARRRAGLVSCAARSAGDGGRRDTMGCVDWARGAVFFFAAAPQSRSPPAPRFDASPSGVRARAGRGASVMAPRAVASPESSVRQPALPAPEWTSALFGDRR